MVGETANLYSDAPGYHYEGWYILLAVLPLGLLLGTTSGYALSILLQPQESAPSGTVCILVSVLSLFYGCLIYAVLISMHRRMAYGLLLIFIWSLALFVMGLYLRSKKQHKWDD